MDDRLRAVRPATFKSGARSKVPTSTALISALLLGFLITSEADAQHLPNDTVSVVQLKQINLEELMQMDITSVSKRPEKLFETPAAAQVVTQEDIRRSGATTLPEALRLAPNLGAARVDARGWAISARGFNGTTSNKLLVMLDGRSVYTPLYSGVFWDVQNAFLDDVERIEVISGPGGTLWGANAINGVINVIEKNSNDSSAQGLRATAAAGTRDWTSDGVRYGGRLGKQASYRVYGMYFSKGNFKLPSGADARDAWKLGQGGFRADWNASELDAVTLHAGLYDGSADQAGQKDFSATGGNVVGRWNRTLGEHSTLETQAYFDRTHRTIPGTFGEELNTYDFDVQHHLSLESRNELVWGAGIRYSVDDVENTPVLAFLPAHLVMRLYTGFLQDELTLIPSTLRLAIGSKFEHNDFSGFEYQPSARISWTPAENQFIWAAVSRPVRTPSRIDRDLFVPGNPPYNFFAGSPNFISEKLIAYEVGYRIGSPSVTFDVATFYNRYDDLRSLEPGPPLVFANGLEGTSYGAEAVVAYQLAGWWRAKSGYAYVQKEIRLKPWSRDLNNGEGEGSDPKHRVKIQSFMDLCHGLELDAWLRLVSEVSNTRDPVPGYVSLDLRLGYRVSPNFALSILGQDLLRDQHPEFGMPNTREEVPRGVLGRIDWTY